MGNVQRQVGRWEGRTRIWSANSNAAWMESNPALLNDDTSTFGVPDPRILICGCGGSGNNTMNRITHLGVEGAITVAINTDKQHLDHTWPCKNCRPSHH